MCVTNTVCPCSISSSLQGWGVGPSVAIQSVYSSIFFAVQSWNCVAHSGCHKDINGCAIALCTNLQNTLVIVSSNTPASYDLSLAFGALFTITARVVQGTGWAGTIVAIRVTSVGGAREGFQIKPVVLEGTAYFEFHFLFAVVTLSHVSSLVSCPIQSNRTPL